MIIILEILLTKIIAKNDEFGLYKTTSGSFIKDENSLGIGDSSVSPTLLMNQVTYRGKTTTSLYDFKDTPTGTVTLTEGGLEFITKIVREPGNAIILIPMDCL